MYFFLQATKVVTDSFKSTKAIGLRRKIFLASHTQTVDNVQKYAKIIFTLL